MGERIDHATEADQIIENGAGGIHNPQMILALVEATLAVADQLRIANRLKVAELDLQHEISGYAPDFRIRPYLDAADWASIEVIEEVSRGD